MKMKTRRILSMLLALVMVLGLLPMASLAAPAMMGEADTVAETPVADHVHAEPAAVDRPAVSTRGSTREDDQPADLLALHEHNFADGLTDSSGFFTIKGSLKSGVAEVTANGVTYKAALKMDSQGSCSFTAKAGDTVTAILSHKSSATTFMLNDVEKTFTNHLFTEKLTADGTYTIKQKSGETYLYYVSVGNACDHTYTYKETPATCTADGSKVGTCSKCGATTTETIPALGHKYDSGAVTKEPTCTATGVKTYTCSVCKETKTETLDPAHKYGSDGICTVCGEHEHKWDAGTVTKAATCNEAGEKTFKCTISGCTETKTEPIPATGKHTYVDGVCSVCGAKKNTGFMKASGHLESAYIEWPIANGVAVYTVFIKAANAPDSAYTQLDDHLVRQYAGYMRADALGLKAGDYVMKVVADGDESSAMVTNPLTVLPHERTGFAFVGGTASGAYNEDGTLKSNAKVIYATKDADMRLGGTKEEISGKSESAPVCIRVIGKIDAGSAFVYQDWSNGLTIEGVGNDATISGGQILIKKDKNVEIRNLGCMLAPAGGKDDLIGIEQDPSYVWVHNCDLFYGQQGGGDKKKGDGALDAKNCEHITFSYNHYWDCGKSGLLGGTSSDQQEYATYHHNWFDHSDSRHPRIRTAKKVHIYNNYYDGVAKYGVGAALNSGAFVEGNYFRSTKYPILISMQGSDGGTFSGENGGMVKAYNNTMVGSYTFVPYNASSASVDFDAYVVKTRDEKVPSTVKAKQGGTTYTNFDTTEDIGVTAAQVQNPDDAKATVMKYAGRVEGGDFKWTFTDADDRDYDRNAELSSALSNYKTSMMKVGGTVDEKAAGAQHTVHTWDGGEVTTPADCKTNTNGVKTYTCTFPNCGQTKTETISPTHNYVNGVCSVCGATQSSGGDTPGGGTVVGASKSLIAGSFKMTEPYTDTTDGEHKKCALLASELAAVENGMFGMVGTVNKRTASNSVAGDTVEFFDLSKSGANGITFTTAAPGTVAVKFSSSGSAKISTVVVKDASGSPLTVKGGTDTYASVKGSTSSAQTVTFVVPAEGTYTIHGSLEGGATNDARLIQVTVTEESTSTQCPPHAWGSRTELHAATCGDAGEWEQTCSKCGEKQHGEIAPTGNHTFGAWSQPDADGNVTRTCSVCGKEETKHVDDPDPSPSVSPSPATPTPTPTKPSHSGTLGFGKELKWTCTAAGSHTELTIAKNTGDVATGDKLIVAFYNNANKFLGSKLATLGTPVVLSGEPSKARLFWLSDKLVPKGSSVTVGSGSGEVVDPTPSTQPTTSPTAAPTDSPAPAKTETYSFAATIKGDLTGKGPADKPNDKVPYATSDTLDTKGFFSVEGTGAMWRTAGSSHTTSNSLELTKSETNVDKLVFTVPANSTATVSVTASSTSKSNTSALMLTKEDGTAVLQNGKKAGLVHGTGSGVTISFTGLTAGTYKISGPVEKVEPTDVNGFTDTVWTTSTEAATIKAADPNNRGIRVLSAEVKVTTAG